MRGSGIWGENFTRNKKGRVPPNFFNLCDITSRVTFVLYL